MNNFIVKLPVRKGKSPSSHLPQNSLHLLQKDSCSFLWKEHDPLTVRWLLGLGFPGYLCVTACTGKLKFLFAQLCKDLQVHTTCFSFYLSSLDGITIFRQSTFFIKILSSAGVQIRVQMKPVMQLSITVDHSFQNRTSGRTHKAKPFNVLEKISVMFSVCKSFRLHLFKQAFIRDLWSADYVLGFATNLLFTPFKIFVLLFLVCVMGLHPVSLTHFVFLLPFPLFISLWGRYSLSASVYWSTFKQF